MTKPSTQTVLDHHLAAFTHGIDDLMQDYDDASIVITPERIYRGIEQIRSFLKAFLANADDAFWKAMKLETSVVEGEIAYVTWSAPPFVTLATDTLHVRDGVISTQTFTSFAA